MQAFAYTSNLAGDKSEIQVEMLNEANARGWSRNFGLEGEDQGRGQPIEEEAKLLTSRRRQGHNVMTPRPKF